MTHLLRFGRGRWQAVLAFLAWSAVFAILYAQSPLYTSNQNQYFLHGLARAGVGGLGNDWLAGTADPTPLFSALVWLTATLTRSGLPFFVYYALLMGVYLYAAFGLADLTFGLRRSRLASLLFVSLFLAAHSAGLRFLLSRLSGQEAAFLVEGGVAGQRLLGQVFQPSTFGVFLVLSIYLFLSGRRWAAVLALATAVSVHPTYLLGGALLTLSYLWTIGRQQGGLRAPLRYGFGMLLAVLPILLYTLLTFWPTHPVLYAQAQQVLVHFRIPPHAIVRDWLDWTVAVKAGVVLAALLVVRRKRLFPVLAIPTAGVVLLTLLQVATGSDTLALLFPWRLSVVLVPVGLSVLLAAAVTRLLAAWRPSRDAARLLKGLALLLLGGLLAVGAARFQLESARNASDPDRAVMEHVASLEPSGAIYLVPHKWATFRLIAQAPIYVDFLSIPYRDTDVLEWYRRLDLANGLYGGYAEPCASLRTAAEDGGVTRVILPAGHPAAACPGMSLLYQDGINQLYEIQP